MEQKAESKVKLVRMTARVIRADGRVENVGTLSGGRFWERWLRTIRIHLINWKHSNREV